MESAKIGGNEEEEAQHTMPYLPITLNHSPYYHNQDICFRRCKTTSATPTSQINIDILLHTEKRKYNSNYSKCCKYGLVAKW